ncbi:MAG TPA: hypothetical protein PLR99_21295 [Polyangiaceae bacterium]|nr:hypothetical protein [Polyangiaceae bacterium]
MKPSLASLPLALAASSILAASALAACSSTATAGDAGADATTAVDAAPLPPTPDAATDAAPPPPQDSGAKDSAADGGALTPEEKLICDARASRAACSDGGGTAEPCDEATKCIYAQISEPAAVASYARCYGAPSCGGDDLCIAQAGEAVGGQASRDYVTACLAKVNECGAAFPDDELCSTAAYAYKGVGAGATACLARPCAEQKACFDAALKPIKDCKVR